MPTSPSGRFAGKAVIVTGGSGHIGLGVALGFAAEGAAITVVGRDPQAGEAAVARLKAAGPDALFVAAEVQTADQVGRAVERTVDRFGGLHVLVNNAAIIEHATHDALVADMDSDHWEEYLAVNVTGPFNATRAAVPAIVASGGGTIVNISSTAADFARPKAAGYGVSKSALHSLTRYTAVDHGPLVRCNEVVLGPIRRPGSNPIYDLIDHDPAFARQTWSRIVAGRLGTPADVANACLFLCADDSSFITGASLVVDGGSHLTTPLADWNRVLLPDDQ
ncbi:MAG TPA: SDR family oxidoreductase [Acidimicrobiales bacterium]|nr:SDR family oxidoreductase [Acidimicrobiales bacterium]